MDDRIVTDGAFRLRVSFCINCGYQEDCSAFPRSVRPDKRWRTRDDEGAALLIVRVVG